MMKIESPGRGDAVVPGAFTKVHDALKRILALYGRRAGMTIAADTPHGCVLLTPPTPRFPQYPGGMPFGSTRVGKAVVSFHLMPPYMSPALARAVPAGLRKRMQGKTCFNFRVPEPVRFRELAALVAATWAEWAADGIVGTGAHRRAASRSARGVAASASPKRRGSREPSSRPGA